MAMASDPSTMNSSHLIPDDEDDYVDAAAAGRRMSGLSIGSSEGCDADVEPSSDDEKYHITASSTTTTTNACFIKHDSLPGTPVRVGPGPNKKEYASETEMGAHRRRRVRRRWAERAGKGGAGRKGECRVLVKARGPDSGPICMDMEEVKACRELGLELPSEWTVEIPCGFDTSSGGDSPIGSWRISSPGDDPRDVKARLRLWAQAVALASASSLSG